MALLWQLKNLVKQRILEHGRRVRLVLRSNSVNQLLESFCKIFGQTLNFDDCHRELNGLKLRDAKLRVRAICDLSLTKVFMIGPDDLSSERVENFDPAVFLNSWSYSINTLKLDYQQFIVRNPVWQRPLVRLAPETFLLPCIGIVDSFYLEYMESIVGPKRSQAFSDLKAAYLEDAVASVFRARLRCAELWQGFRWSNDAADGWENDLCVLLDRTLIIVESKSGKFTQLAKEGRTERLERDAGRLMGASTSQSSRLVNELESGRLVKGVDRDGRQAVLELGLLDHIIVLNVTLEHLGGLGASNTSLKDAHLAQFGSAPTMCLHELQSVGVILQEDFEFVDYLRVRDRLHKRVQYFGDELDLLALYLDPDYTLSLRGRSVESEDFVYAYGQSNALNKYFVGYAPRPVAKRTGFWGLLLNRARQMKGNWVDSTGILLSTPIKWQREFEVRASKLLAAWPKAGAHFTLRDSAVAICFLLHASMTKAERSSKIRQLSQSTQTSCGANEVLVFSIDLSTNASKDLRSVIKNAATISYWRSEMAP